MNQLSPSLASRQRRSVIDDAVQGLGASRGPHVSIRGGRFRLIDANGLEKLVDTHYLDLIFIDANDKPSRVYFEGNWDPSSNDPPLCWSDNGVGPSTMAIQPQNPTCTGCRHNVRGSDVTFSGKPTTACENRKKLAAIVPDDPAITVYEFQVPPGSLSNLRAYTQWIRQQASGIPGRTLDIADFVTRVEFDPNKQFVMVFKPAAWADDDVTIKKIAYIDENKLSDASVGRNDQAMDPDAVRQMLAGGAPVRQQIAAQPAPAPVQQPQFQVPPRQAPQALPPQPQFQAPQSTPPVVNEAGPAAAATPAPKRRGRAPAAQNGAPAPTAAAPFMAPASSPSAPVAPAPVNGQQANADDIPSFLRNQEAPPAPLNPPRFGVGQAPPPPAAIADALNAAMSLPTRG